MPEKLYGLTEKDREQVQLLISDFERLPPQRPGRSAPSDDHQAPEVYVAKTPSTGIPPLIEGVGTGTGTGSGCDYDEPGYAECVIYRVLPPTGTGSHDCDLHLEPVGITRQVLNLSGRYVPADSWTLVIRDKWGSWFVPSSSGAAGEGSVVYIYDVVGPIEALGCGASTALSDQCAPILHLALLQNWDEECNRWEDGDCVFVVEANSKTLEVGLRYNVSRVDRRVQSEINFPVPPCSGQYANAALPFPVDLYVVDAGDLSRTVRVDGVVGRQCNDGSDDEDNLKLYYGSTQRWNLDTCSWEDIEVTVYIAERHGEELVVGERYVGDFDSMLSENEIAGAGTGTGTDDPRNCTPLYLVDCKGFTGTQTVIVDVTCEEPDGGAGPPGADCSGLCIWQWVGSEWLLSFTNCAVGCQCPSPPNFEGLVQGQEEMRLCMAPGGGGADSGGASLMAVYVADNVYECGELISSTERFSHYAGCCDCSSGGDDPDGPGTGTGGTGPNPGTGTGTGTGTGGSSHSCDGTCTWQWVVPGFPGVAHWEVISDDCVFEAPTPCSCTEPESAGTVAGEQVVTDCGAGAGGFSILKAEGSRASSVTVTRSGRIVNKPRVGIAAAGKMSSARKSRCRKLKEQGLPCPDDPRSQAAQPPAPAKPREPVFVLPPKNVCWSAGVMTVPSRRFTYLPRTLESLRAGGFDHLKLFVDGCNDPKGWEAEFNLVSHCRPKALGVVGAWLAALHELYLADPRADRFALFQDDFTCVKNLRQYLEQSPYPSRGYLNLYTFTTGNEMAIKDKPVGWHEAGLVNPPDRNPNLYQTGRGAVALVFDREAIMAALASPHLVHKPSAPDSAGRTKIDGALVTAMNVAGFREYVHNPSLVQHQGHESSRPEAQDPNSGAYRYGHMRAQTYKGDDFDALQLLKT